MKIEFDIQLGAMDMYRYNLWHTYTSFSGYLPFLLAGVAFATAVRKWGEVSLSTSLMYLAFGVLFVVYTPATLYIRSRQQVLGSPVLRNILHFTIDDTGVTTSQEEQSSSLAWDQVYRVVATKHNILVCINPRNAFIIPRAQVTKEYDQIRKIAQEHLDKYRLKMK